MISDSKLFEKYQFGAILTADINYACTVKSQIQDIPSISITPQHDRLLIRSRAGLNGGLSRIRWTLPSVVSAVCIALN